MDMAPLMILLGNFQDFFLWEFPAWWHSFVPWRFLQLVSGCCLRIQTPSADQSFLGIWESPFVGSNFKWLPTWMLYRLMKYEFWVEKSWWFGRSLDQDLLIRICTIPPRKATSNIISWSLALGNAHTCKQKTRRAFSRACARDQRDLFKRPLLQDSPWSFFFVVSPLDNKYTPFLRR